MDNELFSLQMHSIIRLVAANYHLHFSMTMLSKPALMESPNHPSKLRGEENHELVKPYSVNLFRILSHFLGSQKEMVG